MFGRLHHLSDDDITSLFSNVMSLIDDVMSDK